MKKYYDNNQYGAKNNNTNLLQDPVTCPPDQGFDDILLDLTVQPECVEKVKGNFIIAFRAFVAAVPESVVNVFLKDLVNTIQPETESLLKYIIGMFVGLIIFLFVLSLLGCLLSVLFLSYSPYVSVFVFILLLLIGIIVAVIFYNAIINRVNTYYATVTGIYGDLILEMEAYPVKLAEAVETGLCAYPTHVPCPPIPMYVNYL